MHALKFLEPWLASPQTVFLIVARIRNTYFSRVDFWVLDSEDVDLPALEVGGEFWNLEHFFQSAWRGVVVSLVAFTLSVHRLLNLSLSELFSGLFSLITSISESFVFDRFLFGLKQFNILFLQWHSCIVIILLIPMQYSFWTSFHLTLKWLRSAGFICHIAFFWTWTSNAKWLLRRTFSASQLANLPAQRWRCRIYRKRPLYRFNRSFFLKLRAWHHIISADSGRLI